MRVELKRALPHDVPTTVALLADPALRAGLEEHLAASGHRLAPPGARRPVSPADERAVPVHLAHTWHTCDSDAATGTVTVSTDRASFLAAVRLRPRDAGVELHAEGDLTAADPDGREDWPLVVEVLNSELLLLASLTPPTALPEAA